MGKFRRKTLYRILEAAALGLAAVDLVIYLAVARPLQDAVQSQQERFSEVRRQVRLSEGRVTQLQDELETLPATGKEMKQFLTDHVPQRRRSYSRAAGLVHKLTQDSGVQLKQVAYRLDPNAKEPLERLGILVNVEGPFESLLRFMHSLETTDNFLLVRGIIFQPGENGGLALRLLAELYVAP